MQISCSLNVIFHKLIWAKEYEFWYSLWRNRRTSSLLVKFCIWNTLVHMHEYYYYLYSYIHSSIYDDDDIIIYMFTYANTAHICGILFRWISWHEHCSVFATFRYFLSNFFVSSLLLICLSGVWKTSINTIGVNHIHHHAHTCGTRLVE